MKRLAMLLLTVVSIGSSTITVDDDHWLAIVPRSCAEDGTPTVCPPPAVTTGPYTLRVSTQPNSDCYSIPFVNPNGTCAAGKWVACP